MHALIYFAVLVALVAYFRQAFFAHNHVQQLAASLGLAGCTVYLLVRAVHNGQDALVWVLAVIVVSYAILSGWTVYRWWTERPRRHPERPAKVFLVSDSYRLPLDLVDEGPDDDMVRVWSAAVSETLIHDHQAGRSTLEMEYRPVRSKVILRHPEPDNSP